MKETGIIYTAESVRAILEGRKSQTRRVIKPQPELLPRKFGDKKDLWTWGDKRGLRERGSKKYSSRRILMRR